MGDTLTTTDHRRDASGMRYVYPVVSRRAGGVSVGINLNPDNRCNFRCIYCQVPGLRRGAGPVIDVPRLELELRAMLHDIVWGDFMATRVPEGLRQLHDVAFSGNGEPTSSPDLEEAMASVERVLAGASLLGRVPVVLITNGSLIERPAVQRALGQLAALGGEVWFKLDRVTAAGLREVHDLAVDPAAHLRRLRSAAVACPTWIQTCWFLRHGQPPAAAELEAYLAALEELVADGVPLEGVLLYGIARPSQQPEAPELSAMPLAQLDEVADAIRALDLTVKVSP
jgi:wyosine [tRNA(Phe)-imidazoG37] synthetase (radical SAM superfamily)